MLNTCLRSSLRVGKLVRESKFLEAVKARKSSATGRTARTSNFSHLASAAAIMPQPAPIETLRTRSGRRLPEKLLASALAAVDLTPAASPDANILPTKPPKEARKRQRESDRPRASDEPPAARRTLFVDGAVAAVTAVPIQRRSARAAEKALEVTDFPALLSETGIAAEAPAAETRKATRLARKTSKTTAAGGPNFFGNEPGRQASAIPDVKPKRTRKTKETPSSKLKPAALKAGAPSHELRVWTEESMAAAIEHLRQADPKLIPIIERQHGPPKSLYGKGSTDMFQTLTRNICGQQLATKAACAIYHRFLSACKRGPTDPVQPADVLAVSVEDLRAAGLSGMKASYLIDLATHFQNGTLSDEAISVMDDETLITELTKVKGIGRWSCDMFAMFHLAHTDVLPVGDLGVRKGMKALYGLKEDPKPLEMEELAEAWRPYRSLGSYYMWSVIDKKGAMTASNASGTEPVVVIDAKVPI